MHMRIVIAERETSALNNVAFKYELRIHAILLFCYADWKTQNMRFSSVSMSI